VAFSIEEKLAFGAVTVRSFEGMAIVVLVAIDLMSTESAVI